MAEGERKDSIKPKRSSNTSVKTFDSGSGSSASILAALSNEVIIPDTGTPQDNTLNDLHEIHRSYSKVMREFEGDASMEKILVEYNKMYEALKDSQLKQRKYIMQVSGLQCDIKNNEEKVQLALHLSQEDKEIIKTLTKQVNQAWYEAEIMIDREAKARNVILKLQDEISTLTSMVEAGSGLQELQFVAHQAVSERKELEESLVSMKEDLEFKETKVQEVNERMQAKDENFQREIISLKERLLGAIKKKDESIKKMTDMEDYIQSLERIKANITSENAANVAELENCRQRLNKMEKEEADLKADVAKYSQLYNEQQDTTSDRVKEIGKITNDLDALKKRVKTLLGMNNKLKEKVEERENTIKMDERTIKKKDAEIDGLNKRAEQTLTVIKNMQVHLVHREQELKREKDTIHSLQLLLTDSNARLGKINVESKEIRRQAEIANQKSKSLTTKTEELELQVALKEKSNSRMMKEMKGIKLQLGKAIDTVHVMESDKERLYGRINKVLDMVNSLAADNENKETKLLMLLKVNTEQEVKMNNISTKLFRMTNLRDNISNELHLIQLRNDELNLANVNFNKQSVSMAEDLHSKERDFEKLLNNNHVLKSEIHTLQNDIMTWQEEVKKKQTRIFDLDSLIRNMDKVMCRKEHEIGSLKLTIDQVVTQRNLLGYRCIKLREHIQLLTEKNRLMQHVFTSGNKAYSFQGKIIDHLRMKVLDLNRQKNAIMNKIENIDNYKSALGLANTQLVRALARCLATEGEHPCNLHRWRHLKAVDVSHYEMILKIKYLLKRIINKTDEVTKMEQIIFEKTMVVTELKKILHRRPGNEVIRKALLDRHTKEALTNKLKVAIAERNMSSWKYDSQVTQNMSLTNRLMEEKMKNIVLSKRNISLKSKVSILPSISGERTILSSSLESSSRANSVKKK